MKKVLLASTALLLTAGFASAQSLELSGDANAGLKYDEDGDLVPGGDELTVHNEINMTIAGSGATDTGLTFGAFITIDETGGLDDSEVFVSGVFGTVTVGNIDHATDGLGIADVGFDGIGLDDPAEQYKNATAGGPDILYSYAAAGLTFSASAEIEGDESYAVAVEYESQGFSGGIGYITDNNDDDFGGLGIGSNETITVVAGYSQGPLSINGLYSDWNGGAAPSGQGYGVDVSYDVAGATITAAYSNAQDISAGAGLGDSYGIGFAVPLGGGLTVAGGIGSIQRDVAAGTTVSADSRTVADFGLTMAF